MRGGGSSSHKPAAVKEKQRREHMKDLFSILGTLLVLKPYESKSLPTFLDEATTSLKHLKECVDQLKIKKEELEKEVNHDGESSNSKSRLKKVRVMELEDFKLEVNLIFMVNNKKVVTSKVLRVIEQGGVEITYYNLCTVGHNVCCTIHAQAFIARFGFDVKQIEYQLKELVY